MDRTISTRDAQICKHAFELSESSFGNVSAKNKPESLFPTDSGFTPPGILQVLQLYLLFVLTQIGIGHCYQSLWQISTTL